MAIQEFLDQPVPSPKRDYIGYGRYIPKVRWPNNARVAINIVLNYEEGSEYTHPAGRPKERRADGNPLLCCRCCQAPFPIFSFPRFFSLRSCIFLVLY